MRTLVTGATGFVGSHLVDNLVSGGVKVRVLLRSSSSRKYLPNEVEAFVGDITDACSVGTAVEGVDTVFHIASLLGPSNLPCRDFMFTNAHGTENLLKACSSRNISKFIHCSSVGVMGHISNPPADEKHPCNPLDGYGKSKCEAEKIALRFASQGLPVVIVRPAWIYGPRDMRTLKLFRAIKRGRFLFVGDGNSLEHPVYVSDLVEGLKKAGEAETVPGEIFILGGREIVTVKRLCKLIANELNVEIPGFRIPAAFAMSIAYVAEAIFGLFGREAPLDRGKLNFFLTNKAYVISKAEKVLGYNPQVCLEEGIRRTVAWYCEHGYL